MRVGGKWAWVAGGVALALAAGAHAWPLDPNGVAKALNAAGASGWRWRAPARAEFAALPWPRLFMTGAEIASPGGESVIAIPSLEIVLRPDGLLLGRYAAATARLDNPTMRLDLDAAGLETAGRPPVGRVDVRGGFARLVSAKRNFDTMIENVEGRFEWTKPTRPLSFTVRADWRGQAFSAEGKVDSPAALSRGEPAGARLSLASRDADFAFTGAWLRDGASHFDGDLVVNVRSRDSLRHLFGVVAPPLIAAQQFALRGRASASADQLELSEARMEIGPQSFDGSLSFNRGAGKLAISGTLAAETLDLSALLGPRPALIDASGAWSRAAIVPRPNPALDLDLRISAARVAWSGPPITDAAASILQRDGRVSAKIIEASGYGGALAGELTIAREGAETRAQATFSLDNADCGDLLRDWGVTSYSGRCGVRVDARTTGETPADLAASASGSAKFDLQSGVISGINFEQALRRSQRRAIDVARDMTIGQTKFSSGDARITLGGGEARIEVASARGPGALLEAAGTIGLTARDWGVRLTATQASGTGEASADSPRLSFSLTGPWSAPVFAPSGED